MRLSNKVLLTLGIAWLGFLGIAYVGAHEYLLKSFLNLERQQTDKEITRVHQAIDQVSYALGTFTTDWAHWNDAYNYIEGNNPEFIANNFDIAGFINSHINLLIYFDKKGKILIGVSTDLENKKFIPYPKGLEHYIYPTSSLVQRTDFDHDVRGLIATQSGIMLVASSGVSYGDKSKPINGFLVAGRNFSKELVRQLSEATALDLVLYLSSQIDADPVLKKIYQRSLDNPKNSQMVFTNNENIYGYTILKDVNHEPIGMMRLTVPRWIFVAGTQAIKYYLSIFLISGLIITALMGYLLRILVLKRLESLNRQIGEIDDETDYRKRVEVEENDELSSVARQFNKMMKRIQWSHEKLEQKVADLSVSEKNLEDANEKLQEEINERKQAEAKVAVLNEKLVLAARRAGMADISTEVLHNVGNILNSVATSVSLAKEKTAHSKANKLARLCELLEQHKDDLNSFIQRDEKGKHIPEYIKILAQCWEQDNQYILKEIQNLDSNVSNIREVVTRQQSLHGMIGMAEKINLIDLVEDALTLNKSICEQAGVRIVRDYQFNEQVIIDRVKLLHILVNVIKNGVDALLESDVRPRIINIQLCKKDDLYFVIQVIDNGVGIAVENIKNIFSQGFTTKKDGHGFGLHASANAAQEMGGSLFAKSTGLGKGATFILTLPFAPLEKTDEKYLEAEL